MSTSQSSGEASERTAAEAAALVMNDPRARAHRPPSSSDEHTTYIGDEDRRANRTGAWRTNRSSRPVVGRNPDCCFETARCSVLKRSGSGGWITFTGGHL